MENTWFESNSNEKEFNIGSAVCLLLLSKFPGLWQNEFSVSHPVLLCPSLFVLSCPLLYFSIWTIIFLCISLVFYWLFLGGFHFLALVNHVFNFVLVLHITFWFKGSYFFNLANSYPIKTNFTLDVTLTVLDTVRKGTLGKKMRGRIITKTLPYLKLVWATKFCRATFPYEDKVTLKEVGRLVPREW